VKETAERSRRMSLLTKLQSSTRYGGAKPFSALNTSVATWTRHGVGLAAGVVLVERTVWYVHIDLCEWPASQWHSGRTAAIVVVGPYVNVVLTYRSAGERSRPVGAAAWGWAHRLQQQCRCWWRWPDIIIGVQWPHEWSVPGRWRRATTTPADGRWLVRHVRTQPPTSSTPWHLWWCLTLTSSPHCQYVVLLGFVHTDISTSQRTRVPSAMHTKHELACITTAANHIDW